MPTAGDVRITRSRTKQLAIEEAGETNANPAIQKDEPAARPQHITIAPVRSSEQKQMTPSDSDTKLAGRKRAAERPKNSEKSAEKKSKRSRVASTADSQTMDESMLMTTHGVPDVSKIKAYPAGISKSLARLVMPMDIEEADLLVEETGGRDFVKFFLEQYQFDSAASNLALSQPITSVPESDRKTADDLAEAVESNLVQLQTLGFVYVPATDATSRLANRLMLYLLATISRIDGGLNPSKAQILPGGRWQINVEGDMGAAHFLDGVMKVLADSKSPENGSSNEDRSDESSTAAPKAQPILTNGVSWTPHHPQLLVALRTAEHQLWHRDFDTFGVCGLMAVRDTVGPEFLPASHSGETYEAYLRAVSAGNLKDDAVAQLGVPQESRKHKIEELMQPFLGKSAAVAFPSPSTPPELDHTLCRPHQFRMRAGDVFVFLPTLIHRGVGTGRLRPMLSTSALLRPKRGQPRKPSLPSLEAVQRVSGVTNVISFHNHSYQGVE
ncbi:hypothetical protein BJ742DRAFT_789115 [Cladochytrium replicatum]|nr:hypothetical protein BJ742DRAFT_789115 [Cladochytrium replicatum]